MLFLLSSHLQVDYLAQLETLLLRTTLLIPSENLGHRLCVLDYAHAMHYDDDDGGTTMITKMTMA